MARTAIVRALRALLVPAAPGRLEAYPVSTDVNNVANNGAELIQPLPLTGEAEGLFEA